MLSLMSYKCPQSVCIVIVLFSCFFYTVEVLKKIDIPSVFIGETSANSLKEEFTYEKG